MLEDIATLTGAPSSPRKSVCLWKKPLCRVGQAKRIEVARTTPSSSMAPARKKRSRHVSAKSTNKPKNPPATTTRKSCRNAKPSWLRRCSDQGRAATEVEMKEKKARVEDALHATRAAVEEGIVPGGGVALLRAKIAVAKLKGDNARSGSGITIVLRAMESPLAPLCKCRRRAICGGEQSG